MNERANRDDSVRRGFSDDDFSSLKNDLKYARESAVLCSKLFFENLRLQIIEMRLRGYLIALDDNTQVSKIREDLNRILRE